MSPSESPVPFVQCRDCRAWVDGRAEECPICGIAWPTSRWLTMRQESGLAWRDLAATMGGLCGILSGLLLWQFWQHAIRYGTPGPLRFTFLLVVTGIAYALGRALTSARAAFFIGCGALAVAMPVVLKAEAVLTFPDGLAGSALVIGFGFFGWLAGRIWGPGLAAQRWECRQPRNVRDTRRMLEQRLVELHAAREKMLMLGLRLAQQLPGGTQHPALATLRTAVEATDAQCHSHAIHAWQFATAMWQNQAQPILAQWRHFDAAQCDAAGATLDQMTKEGQKLLETWQNQPEAEDPRGQRVITQQQRLLESVAHLRQAILLRQATAMAQAAPGIQEAFAVDAATHAALSQIDELRQGARFLDLTGAATDLLAENERLAAEHAAIREVEKLVGG